MALTIIVNNPLFVWLAYGGNLKISNEILEVIPADGVGIRFGFGTESSRIVAGLNRHRLSSKGPVFTDKMGKSFQFTVDNITGREHKIQLELTGTAGTIYHMKINGKKVKTIRLEGASELAVDFVMPAYGCQITLFRN